MRNFMNTIAKAYMISGDMYGNYGLKNNHDRKLHLSMYNDSYQMAKDWEQTGEDMYTALKKYSNIRELKNGR